MVLKKKGRPKRKEGKRVTIYLSENCIKKLNEMTIISRNKSALIEDLISEKFNKINDGAEKREGLEEGGFQS